jgi:hypothetical protein
MAPKYNRLLNTAGFFEPDQISIDVTVTSLVYLGNPPLRGFYYRRRRAIGGGARCCGAASRREDGSFIARVSAFSTTRGVATPREG